MSETQELKLACLHHAGGDLDKAKAHYEWVIGSAPEASEQRATDQPEQPFNYRHPSKHDGSMPRRCYLDQLTPEELMIRDVAATVEGLGAHPLLTATVIKLMQAGEALADWVDIGLRDKAIQALLDPVPSPSPESSSQETVTEAAPEDLPMSDAEFEALPEFEDNEPEEVISILTGDPAIEPESGLHGDPVEAPPVVSELDSQGTPQASIEQSQSEEKFNALKDGGEAGFWAAARGLTKIEELA